MRTVPLGNATEAPRALVVARAVHAAIAILVAAAMVVQVIVAVRVSGSPHQVTTGVLRGSSLPGRLVRVLSFFTIQSNLLAGVVSAQLAIRPTRDGPVWRAIRLAALVGITVTGIVYSTVLARIHEPNGTAETLVNVTVHYLVPIMTVVGWLLFGPRPRTDRATVLGALVFPALWLLYTLVRGAIWHWYPYPFLDVTAHGYAVVVVNAVLVTVVLAAVAVGFAFGDARLPAAPDPTAPTAPATRVVRPAG